MAANNKKGASDNVKTIVTILLLLGTFIFPLTGILGLGVMWFWTTWAKWIKVAVSIIVAPLIIIFMGGALSSFNPSKASRLGGCVKQCNSQFASDTQEHSACKNACVENN